MCLQLLKLMTIILILYLNMEVCVVAHRFGFRSISYSLEVNILYLADLTASEVVRVSAI